MTRKRKQSDLAEFDPSKYLDDDEAVAEYVRLAMEDGDPGLLAAALGDERVVTYWANYLRRLT